MLHRECCNCGEVNAISQLVVAGPLLYCKECQPVQVVEKAAPVLDQRLGVHKSHPTRTVYDRRPICAPHGVNIQKQLSNP